MCCEPNIVHYSVIASIAVGYRSPLRSYLPITDGTESGRTCWDGEHSYCSVDVPSNMQTVLWASLRKVLDAEEQGLSMAARLHGTLGRNLTCT